MYPDFEIVKKLIIIADADISNENTFKSISDCLKRNSFIPPEDNMGISEGLPQIGIYLMPGNSSSGMLEDLFLKTINENPIKQCMDTYIESAITVQNNMGVNLLNLPEGKIWNVSKAKCQIYLAVMPIICKSIGHSVYKGYWDLEHNSMKELKQFLQNLM